MSGLTKLATSYGIPVVEDAAEALGSIYGDKPCGSLGLVSAVSFNGNKIITTGGGGAVLTDDGDLAAQARHLSTTAKLPILGSLVMTRLHTTIECLISMLL